MSVKDRIKTYLKSINLSVTAFENSLNVANGYVNSISKSIGVDKIELIIEKYPNLNIEWLLAGKGNMIKSETIIKADPKPEKDSKLIPLVPVNALAGFGTGELTVMEYDIIKYYDIPEFKNADFIIPVSGCSMQPKYFGGDMLACRIINSVSFFQYGVPHVITIKDRGTVVKRVFQGSEKNILELRSDNPDYPPYEIPMEDIVNISIVIGVIRLE